MRKHFMTKALLVFVVCFAMIAGLIACDNEVTYTATFVTNGGSEIAPLQNVTSVDDAPQPTRDGYTFDGWYTDEALTEKADFPFTLKANTTFYAKWALIEYTAEFVTNGGTAVETKTGTVIESAPETTRQGYSFAGWYRDEALKNAATFPFTLTEDVKFYAKWSLNTYKVTFVTNGGSEVAAMDVAYIQSAPVSTLDKYTLVGWFTDEDLTDQVEFPLTLTADITLYAKWTRTVYDVTFETNGGTAVDPMKVYEIETAPETTRYAYVFDGWYVDADFNQAAVFPCEINENTIFYAKWTVDESAVAVTFDYAEATEDNEETERMILPGDPVGTLPEPKKFGYDFAGWFDGDVAVTADTVIDAAVTFVAQWTPKTITITLDYGTEALNAVLQPYGAQVKTVQEVQPTPAYEQLFPSTIETTVGETVSLPAQGLLVQFYALFKGEDAVIFFDSFNGTIEWYLDGVLYDGTTPVIADGDITATIHYETVNLYFDPTDGEFVNPEVTGELALPKGISRSVVTYIIPEVYREHYEASWHSDVSSSNLNSDAHYSASWIEVNPKVTLDPNGGTLHEDALESYEMTVGVRIYYTISISFSQLATRPGYNLLGWVDQYGVPFTESDNYPDYEDRTLTAQWEKATFTATFDYAGGQGSPAEMQFVFESEMTDLPAPTRSGYEFGGWYDDNMVKVENGDIFNYTENVTFTAMWVSDTPVEITLNTDGGTISTGESSLQLYEGKAIGELPVPERDKSIFVAWTYNGEVVTEDTLLVLVDGIDEFVATYKEGYSKGLTFAYTQKSGKEYYTVQPSPDVTGEVLIPATYDDGEHGELPIGVIASSAFTGNTTITSVIMRAVTEIGASAFQGCTALETVEFSDVLVAVKSSAFDGCTSLSIDLVIGETVNELGSYSFRNTAIKTVKICGGQNYSTTTAKGIFSGCTSLTSIVFEFADDKYWTNIPESFADGCSNLSEFSYTKANYLSSIGTYAFRGTALTTFTMPAFSSSSSYCSIGKGAFTDTVTLTSFDFGSGGTNLNILTEAFLNTGLTEIELTSRVKSIATNVFNTVKTVTISASSTITASGANMFGDAVENIYVPESKVDTYKAAANWSDYADIISAKP